MTAPLSLLEHAFALAKLGHPVFPCGIRSKAPMIAGGNGCLDATVAPDVIRDWWARWPLANIGLATGRTCWALDIDGQEGLDAIAGLEDQHRWLPTGPASVTGTGGMHMYFAADARITNKVKVLPGLDARSRNGYVCAPPSRHPNGNLYSWLPGRDPWSVALPEAPPWLLDLFDPPQPARPTAPKAPLRPSTTPYIAKAMARELAAVATAAPGTRNATLNKSAFNLGRFISSGELGAVDVGEALVGAALAAGLDRIEATNTVASGLRAALRRSA